LHRDQTVAWWGQQGKPNESIFAFLVRQAILRADALALLERCGGTLPAPTPPLLVANGVERWLGLLSVQQALGVIPSDTPATGGTLVSGSILERSGQAFGPYRLGRQRGFGPRGVVYEAADDRRGTRIALKLLGRNPQTAAEPMQGARQAARMRHPNCVDVGFTGEVAGIHIIEMALAAGGSAQDVLTTTGPFDPLEATRIVCLAAEGLAVAHASGIVHENLKPSNVLLADNENVWLSDFAGKSPPGAPGTTARVRADVSRLAALYCWLLTGQPLKETGNPVDLPLIDLPALHRVGTPSVCLMVINRAFNPDKDRRIRSASDLGAALRHTEELLRNARAASAVSLPERPRWAPEVARDDEDEVTKTQSGEVTLGPPVLPLTVEPQVGMALGKCLLTQLLGRGATGIVFRALHRGLNRPVAIKMLQTGLLEKDPSLARQFRAEAQLLAQLQHPHIVRVWEFCDDPVRPYLVLEYVEGQTLGDLIEQKGPVAGRYAVRIIAQVALGLQAAQRLGVVHRDVKPGNILLTREGQAKLTDLGTAVMTTRVEAGTDTMVGTVAYMAPEQATGGGIDHRADIYALGATLYHALTGQLPFAGRSRMEVLLKHAKSPLTPPHQVRARVDPAVSLIVLRMMAKRPTERYASYEELLADLVQFDASVLAPT
jgi:serine/threonine protein kinase